MYCGETLKRIELLLIWAIPQRRASFGVGICPQKGRSPRT